MENNVNNPTVIIENDTLTKEQKDMIDSKAKELESQLQGIIQEAKEKLSKARAHTNREEVIYKTTEKVLDTAFNTYGKTKNGLRVVGQKTVDGSKTVTAKLGSFLSKIGSKLESVKK